VALFSGSIDFFTLKHVGWALSSSPDTELTIKELMMAFESRLRSRKVTFHSNQGVQCRSLVYRQAL
jgi:putative transposase